VQTNKNNSFPDSATTFPAACSSDKNLADIFHDYSNWQQIPS